MSRDAAPAPVKLAQLPITPGMGKTPGSTSVSPGMPSISPGMGKTPGSTSVSPGMPSISPASRTGTIPE